MRNLRFKKTVIGYLRIADIKNDHIIYDSRMTIYTTIEIYMLIGKLIWKVVERYYSPNQIRNVINKKL